MHRIFGSLSALIILLLSTPSAWANQLTNGSFELGTFVSSADPGVVLLGSGSVQITGWETFGGDLAWIDNSNNYAVVASDGVKSLDLTGDDQQPFGGVQQTIATIAGQSYILEFDLGGNLIFCDSPSLLASAAGASASFTFTPAATVQEWQHFQLPFTATSDSTLVSLLGNSNGGQYIGLDNVSATATPEP